ncbi:class I SAM-dependent methyltransferase [Streptomyces sp. NBS 14/10]|uniref:SAM-dependent methyltransferase n=1 Tax=Streptomyces sp. NBS 14/10 TaxID=1945643 RepID=UPI000B7D1668|nr:class I SAM-dependent methyltransferase [Streptomyces sp. NBS 14/10]KAK1185317.1 class I SAM-dependent methyltransferase [Streptomyces sp. NBS 14/10]NUS86697.1 class I SAM-dependent methyltransferase [Streptomyces sp.]
MTTVTPQAAYQATNQHYELPAELFAGYLDQRLKYSSGLYTDQNTDLDQAQTDKLHFVARQLGLTGGERLLDIGCGWGSLILFMAQEYGCHATGVTPSRPQLEYIRAQAEATGVADLITLEHGSFSDIEVAGPYDAITMLGSIVHMPNRTAVLRKVHELLRRGGSLYLSESCFRNHAAYEEFSRRPGTKHVTEDIFGFADMVPLSTLVEAVESAGFSLTALSDLTAHYHRTIEDWEQRIHAERDRVERAAPGMSEPLIRYLRTANAGWGYTTKHYALSALKSRMGPTEAP